MSIPLRVPDHFGIRGTLAQSGVSVSYRAVDLRDGRDVVVKALRPLGWLSEAEAGERAARMLSRLAPLAGLRHPHLCPVYEVGEFGDTVYCARDWVDGASAAALLGGGGPVGTEARRALYRQAAQALRALREAGLAHGAVRAENLFVRADGSACLTDPVFSAAAGEAWVDGVRLVLAGTAGRDDAAALASLLMIRTRERRERRASARRAPSPALFPMVWRPAAAAGLFGALATVGGIASSDKRTPPAPRPRAVSTVAVPAAPALSPEESEFVRLAARRQGAGALAHPDVAALLGLTEEQRLAIEDCLAEQRARVTELVSAAADGATADVAPAMRQLRASTSARILLELDSRQRERWIRLTAAPPAPGESVL